MSQPGTKRQRLVGGRDIGSSIRRDKEQARKETRGTEQSALPMYQRSVDFNFSERIISRFQRTTSRSSPTYAVKLIYQDPYQTFRVLIIAYRGSSCNMDEQKSRNKGNAINRTYSEA